MSADLAQRSRTDAGAPLPGVRRARLTSSGRGDPAPQAPLAAALAAVAAAETAN